MRNFILVFLASFMLFSCDIQKQASKSKTETDYQEDYEHTRKRKGDTVAFIPRIQYRDTTIYTVNREGTTIRTVFDKQGNLQSAECFASMIEEMFKGQLQLQQSTKDKEKEKTEEVNTEWILYIIIAVVVIVCFFIFMMFRMMNQNAAAMKIILERLK